MEGTTIIKEKTIPMPLMAVSGSDTKPIVSLPPSTEKKTDFGPENGLRQEQDKEVARFAPPPLPKSSDSGKTHMAVTARRRGPNNEEKRKLRSVAFQFGPGLLRRMEGDEAFIEHIHAIIDTNHFLDDVVKDTHKRQPNVAPIFHEMGMAYSKMIDEADKDRKLPSEAKGLILKEMILLAVIGSLVLEEEMLLKGEKKDAETDESDSGPEAGGSGRVVSPLLFGEPDRELHRGAEA